MLLNPYRFGGGDPYFANVVALLHFDGSNGSTTFTDQTGKTWTAQGDAQLSTSWAQFGTASGAFDGTGDYLTTTNDPGFTFGNGQFTIEATLNQTVVVGGIVSRWGNSSDTATWSFAQQPGGLGLYFYYQAPAGVFDYISYAAWSPSTGVAYRVAVDRDAGGVLRLYVDGAVVATKSIGSLAFVEGATPTVPHIGAQFNGAGAYVPVNGFIDEVRVTNGVGRYGGAYTPAASPFPNF